MLKEANLTKTLEDRELIVARGKVGVNLGGGSEFTLKLDIFKQNMLHKFMVSKKCVCQQRKTEQVSSAYSSWERKALPSYLT